MSDKYLHLKGRDEILAKKCEYAEYGLEFRCPSCGCIRYLLGRDAKFYDGDRLGCKSCGQLRIELKGKMGQQRAVHLNNIRHRKSDVVAGKDNLVNK